MRLTLKEHNAKNIKRARHIMRAGSCRQSLTLRNGKLYTMRYNPGRQPRTASQQKSWSLFAEANRLTTADFHNPSRKAYWQKKFEQQSRYKTARGLAKAYYIKVLKAKMSSHTPDVPTLVHPIAHTFRPLNLPAASSLIAPRPARRYIRRPSTQRQHTQ